MRLLTHAKNLSFQSKSFIRHHRSNPYVLEFDPTTSDRCLDDTHRLPCKIQGQTEKDWRLKWSKMDNPYRFYPYILNEFFRRCRTKIQLAIGEISCIAARIRLFALLMSWESSKNRRFNKIACEDVGWCVIVKYSLLFQRGADTLDDVPNRVLQLYWPAFS